jgi:hypothetical protein
MTRFVDSPIAETQLKLTAYLQPGEQPVIRPAPLERAWMDKTPERFAYRCLPLNIANAHGWEVLCPARVRTVWFGRPDLAALTIESGAPAHLLPVSHFGSGILTFHVGCLLRTEPGIELWVQGPPNRAKHGISALSGVVETDWAPFTFTMNWQFTQPGEIIFEQDEPFCFFFPIAREILAMTEPEFRRLSENSELNAEFQAWQKSRGGFIEELAVEGSKAREKRWQRDYFRGQTVSGAAGPRDHRTKQRVPPFKPLGK